MAHQNLSMVPNFDGDGPIDPMKQNPGQNTVHVKLTVIISMTSHPNSPRPNPPPFYTHPEACILIHVVFTAHLEGRVAIATVPVQTCCSLQLVINLHPKKLQGQQVIHHYLNELQTATLTRNTKHNETCNKMRKPQIYAGLLVKHIFNNHDPYSSKMLCGHLFSCKINILK